ncbi:MAG: pilus assembly PilX N-terminal domain-containing protein [Candidatus Moraniibacteriota bacterium]
MKQVLNKKEACFKKQRGSTLAYVLVIMTVVTIILVSMLGYITSQIKFSINRVEKEKAFQIAEAGIYYYRWYLAHETSGKTALEINSFLETGGPMGFSPDPVEYYNSMGAYQLSIEPPAIGSTIINVESTGWSNKFPDMKRTVKVRFRRPSWSEYSFLSNSFMNFGSEAEVYGKVHSNDGIRFDGLAHNTVSSLLPRFNDPTWGGNSQEFGVHTTVNPADAHAPAYPWPDGTIPERPDVFMGGREFPISEVSFTGVSANLTNMYNKAISGSGRYFDNSGQGRRIIIKSNGTYDVCKVNSANSNTHVISSFDGIVSGASGSYSGTNGNTCTTSSCCIFSSCPYIQSNRQSRGKCVSLDNYSIINNGVIFVDNSIWLDGTVNNKRITVVARGASSDIYIGTTNSNIRYVAYNCDNSLGLIAERDVRVLGTCPDQYVVDAAILAQLGTVGINDNGFSGKTSLVFNGAIASYLQPYFQHGNSGFAVRLYNYDNNLLYCPPPYFPTGTEYAIDLWEEL